MEVKDFLRLRRTQLGITQEKLATRLSELGEETSYARVGHWETGRNNPPLHSKKFRSALAVALEIDVNEMMSMLGYVVADNDRSPDALLAATIIDELPPKARQLALDYLRLLQTHYP